MRLRNNLLLGVLVLMILPITIIALMFQKGAFAGWQASPNSLEKPVQFEAPAPPESGGPIDGEKVSLDVAKARIPWTVPLPTYKVSNADLVEVWVSGENDAPKERQIYLIYADGLEISIWPEAQSPDFSSWEAPFHAVKVKGISGVGTEPGVQKVEDEEQKYPGSVTWWQNGLVINIYGDFPLTELLKVAESMPEPVWTQ